jgi:2-polyprenyl-3-methyl-5-hydroxy-6-metoxy-1,4-benzoquinol methylase
VATLPLAATTDEVADRVFRSCLGAFETLSIHLGDRLGWYRALDTGGPATPAELVARAGGDERYAREWLEQQAVYGLLDVVDGPERRFALGRAEAEVLTDEASLAYLAPLARMVATAAVQLPTLVTRYRDGGGIPWADFGADMAESQADMNRPWFESELVPALGGLDDLDGVLARPGARIADLGCGGGWSAIALAHGYPAATVEGYDVDAPSVELARANAESAGVADRVRFHHVDVDEIDDTEAFDAVFAFECVHDLPYPVDFLRAARRMVRPDGRVVVMDEAVADEFTAPGDDVERLMYGFSLFICLPDGRAHERSAATGTVLRADRLRDYALLAGFRDLSVLPLEGFGFFRFYELHR